MPFWRACLNHVNRLIFWTKENAHVVNFVSRLVFLVQKRWTTNEATTNGFSKQPPPHYLSKAFPNNNNIPPSLTMLRTTTCIYNSQCVFSWLPFNIPWVCEIGIYGPRWWVQNGSRLRFSPPTKDPTCNPTHGCTNTRTYIRKQVWIAQRPRNRVTRCSRLHTNRVNEIKVKTVLTLAGGCQRCTLKGRCTVFELEKGVLLHGFWKLRD